ncbi:MAG TPA: protealysin inhibitor emfourin [Kribbella sp.]|nr:protealysin inhibitor emfourin [Kribbella sp.]
MILKVVRSGGFAGLVARGELDTAAEPDGGRLEETVRRLDPARLGSGRPQPDRYLYRLEVRDAPDAEPTELMLAEQDLDQDAAWLLDRVLTRE